MKILISTLTLLFLCICSLNAATINGYLLDKKNLEPIFLASVGIYDSKIVSETDSTGHFILNDVPVGKHTIYIMHIAYYYFRDSINIKNQDQIIEITIKLEHGVIPIETVPEIEKYHIYFNKYELDTVLKIKLDSIGFSKTNSNSLQLYATFYNTTDTPIYVIRDIECLRMAEPIIINSHGKRVRENTIFSDCMAMKTLPDTTDFLKIEPKDSINYPPVYLYFNNFKRYPADNYKISLIYKNHKRKQLPGIYSGWKPKYDKFKKEKFYFNMALRGIFKSVNYLEFNNSEMLK